jgi:hypothetical protein
MYYKRWMGYHVIVMESLAESYRLLRRFNLLDVYPYFRDNGPWNMLAGVAWVYQLGGRIDQSTGRSGAIWDRWTDSAIDGTPTPYGTAPGVQVIYEVLRTFDVTSYMPLLC